MVTEMWVNIGFGCNKMLCRHFISTAPSFHDNFREQSMTKINLISPILNFANISQGPMSSFMCKQGASHQWDGKLCSS